MTDADLIRKPFSEDYDLYKNGVKTYVLKRKPFSENYDLYDLYGNLYKEDGLSFELRRKPWSSDYNLYKGGILFDGIIGGEEAPWLPTNIGGCKRWGRGDTYVKDEVDRVSQGTDKSGNGNHFTQATDAAKPVWYSAYFNGQDAFKFDGIDDTMVKTGGIIIPQPLTIFLVFANIDLYLSTTQTFFRNNPLSLLADILPQVGGSSQRLYAGSASIQSPTLDLVYGGNYIVEYQYAGADSRALLNNVEKVSGNPGTNGFDTSDLYLGSYGSTGFMGLYLLEDLIYDSILSSGDRTLLYSYFNTRYGL